MAERVVRNRHLRSPITAVEERPELDRLGRAGIRLKLDLMLAAHHGHSEREWQALGPRDREVLRLMAREEDPALGVSHQVDAIGALAALRDQAALLQLGELARDGRADLRLQVASTRAIGEIGGEEVRPVLRGLLGAKAPEVRAQAARGLARIGSAADLGALESLAERDATFAADVAREALDVLRRRLRLP